MIFALKPFIDVYKRQILTPLFNPLRCFAAGKVFISDTSVNKHKAVSYTHLDVYKRQGTVTGVVSLAARG